ncbi:Hvo_1808 family surface protein [Halovivax limisalsi]|uniref:Hvo_1808 family surface protein n=1 Tax=Halovivax limisalsi TaxID=1453760 RepID=UPI001FFD4469|nr:Hvo_1808 family surface protein [Halovivax limisalsi]
MNTIRACLLSFLVVVSFVAVPLSAGAVGAGATASPADTASTAQDVTSSTVEPGVTGQPSTMSVGPSSALQSGERESDPSMEETIGYVRGYWHDDELPVDDREGAHVNESELQTVVHRSMARAEVVRGLTFQSVPDVELITRDDFRNETDDLFGNLTDSDRLLENVRYEAYLMAGRDTDAVDAYQQLYGGSVGGYYDPETDEIVIVSDSTDEIEVAENTLGHELVHALQDQHFNITRYDRRTLDEDGAINGLIEGGASFAEDAYVDRCGEDWACLEPEASPGGEQPAVWGQYFQLIMPYDEGPDFVEYVHDRGGWEAVDARYDEPPASTAEVIHPGTEREPVNATPADRSTDEWSRLEADQGATVERVGEAGLVSMFMHDSVQRQLSGSVIDIQDWVSRTPEGGETYEYAQPITDGWAGDGLAVYTTDARTADESGYVWRTEWTNETEAAEFRDAYLELLGLKGAEPVADAANTLRLEETYPGAYHVSHEGSTVRIVRAPSADELSAVHEPTGSSDAEQIDHPVFDADGETEADGSDGAGDGNESDGADGGDGDDGESLPGFGPTVALVGLALAVGLARRR